MHPCHVQPHETPHSAGPHLTISTWTPVLIPAGRSSSCHSHTHSTDRLDGTKLCISDPRALGGLEFYLEDCCPGAEPLIYTRPQPTWPSTGLPSLITMAECLSMEAVTQGTTSDSGQPDSRSHSLRHQAVQVHGAWVVRRSPGIKEAECVNPNAADHPATWNRKSPPSEARTCLGCKTQPPQNSH